jgi:hypothetical protein
VVPTICRYGLSPKSGDNAVENVCRPLDPAVLIVLPKKAARV